MPLGVFQSGVRSILNKDGAYLFYMHPWEIDPGQPRVEQASMASRFKHYTNLAKTEDKLRKMIESFADLPVYDVSGLFERKNGVRQD